MSQKRILIVVGDFVEDYEIMVPFQMLVMVGHDAHVVCPGKKSGDQVITAVHDFEGHQTYTERPGHNFTLNADFDSVDPSTYDALMIPGGRSPEYLRLNPRVLEIVRHFADSEKPIAAVCRGQQVLTAAGVLEGRRVQAYPAVRPELEHAGAIWEEPTEALDSVCVDANLVTSPAWPAQAVFVGALLKLLGTQITP